MSRIGKQPIIIPDNVEVKLDGDLLSVKGAKGALKQVLHPAIRLAIGCREVIVNVENENDHTQKALWGLFRSLINNMVLGVTKEFSKKLEVIGIGYKSAVKGNKLVLNVGFSHPVEFELPMGIACTAEKNIVTLTGADKQQVGEVAANIRRIRKPEPYKGTGIRYVDEVVRKKAGKTAAKGAA
ncbi:MAG: 50S ribosomal protein L6 [Parcubacteria group bacterium]